MAAFVSAFLSQFPGDGRETARWVQMFGPVPVEQQGEPGCSRGVWEPGG